MFSLFSRKNIKVIFINHSTGEVIQTVELPQQQLPESFDQPVNIQIADKEYWIVKAGPAAIFDDFTLELHEDHWRQIEYLPLSLLPVIQEEMADVEKILFPENVEETSPGFKEIHVRKRMGANHLAIPFEEFCELIRVSQKGCIRFFGYDGFVENGFALRSANYTYYGTMQGNVVKELCLESFESAETEFYQVVAQYNLVMVAWCNGQISTI